MPKLEEYSVAQLRSHISKHNKKYRVSNYWRVPKKKLIEIIENLLFKDLSGVFNVVGDERLTKYDFGLKIASEIGANHSLVKKTFLSGRDALVKRPFDLSLSNKKIKKSISIPIKSLSDQIKEMIIYNKQKI